ncbi:MAG TPA: hypothetical protein VG057_16995, partial [Solirubrobacteraceae bacterium]|nr:hypothetical protein [Solirubrobacteraceae bacterium]
MLEFASDAVCNGDQRPERARRSERRARTPQRVARTNLRAAKALQQCRLPDPGLAADGHQPARGARSHLGEH